MTLTERCKEIVLGTILGDGCLERNGSNVRLRIDHSVTQASFVEWKWHELQELSPLQTRLVERVDHRTGSTHRNLRFATKTLPALNHYYSLFYGEGRKKMIPETILNLLNSPLSLAVWYMDDGGRRSDCRSGYLNTNAYEVRDVEILKQCLKVNFDVESTTHFAAGQPRIYIPSSQFAMFCDVIRPFVIREMKYKLL